MESATHDPTTSRVNATSRPGSRRRDSPGTPSPPEESGGDEVDESQTLGVFSWGGSRIAAGVTAADDSVVRFVEGTIPDRISTVNVARIVLKPVPIKWRKVLRDKRKGVLLRNGDFIEGEFKSLKEDWLVLNSVIFGVKVYGLDEVLALILSKVADKPARDSRFELVLESGSLFHVRSFKLDKGGVIVDDPTVGKFLVPLTELDEMRRINFN